MDAAAISLEPTADFPGVELLALPRGPALLLDVGCGSGLSGDAIERAGHSWVGVDVSPSMLGVAVERPMLVRAESEV
jgi:18S rRNA (guanine1575-N7)-methyltransferase